MPIPPALVGLYGVVTLASLVRPARWPAELLTHLRLQLVAAGLVGAALCLLSGERWEWAGIALGLSLVHVGALPDRQWSKPEERSLASPGLTVVWANVWQKRGPLERTLAWAQEQNADVIIIGEFPEASPADLLIGDYPNRIDTGPAPNRSYAVRMVAFSRIPFESADVLQGPGPMVRPFLAMKVAVGGKAISVVGVHPVPPYKPGLLKERDAHIGMLGPLLKGAFVLAGDFNATPWCSGYAAIPGRRIGAYLLKPTWLSNMPIIGLPIDHIMASTDMKASLYRVASSLGSDHRAILARVHPPAGVGA